MSERQQTHWYDEHRVVRKGEAVLPDTRCSTCGNRYDAHNVRHQFTVPRIHAEAPQITHHPECYREHHACAVARLDRLREAMEGSPEGPWYAEDGQVYNRDGYYIGSDYTGPILVAVRDITEGR